MKLKSMLNEKFSSYGLQTYPHIDSKAKRFTDKHKMITEMFHTFGFSCDDTTKMIKYERQSCEGFCKVCPTISPTLARYYFYVYFIVYDLHNLFLYKYKKAKGLWRVSFPYLDELDKVFGPDRVIGAASENF